ncbi:MAG: glucose-6-phosphate isomerase, partial [Acidobacteriota bacterium]|nr:glucose-6-phosphate isomerase [Acidobacteriota bacterium]
MRLPEFDSRNALESAVGAEGLSAGDLQADAASAAVEAFRGRVRSGEIGFPNLPKDAATARAVVEFADDLRPNIDDVLVVGIGGSALGAYALDAAMRGPHPVQTSPARKSSGKRKRARPRLVSLDNVDPGFVAAALERLDPKRTAVCVIAKSGSTAETLATFLIVRRWITEALGKRARARIIAITDAKKGDLLAIAKEEKYPLFFIPANVGGRFSVFTPVGLVPAALIGLDVAKLLRGAADANKRCWSSKLEANPALESALVHHALNTRKKKSIEVVFAYSSYLWGAA